MVGTRKPLELARHAAYVFGVECANLGLTVVSGLAYGIDGLVHRGVVAQGGLGIGVLASGVLEVSPLGNRRLAGRLIQLGGCVVSEFNPGDKPLAYRFIQRNRIISGLSKGVVIIDAPPGSGALHTLDFALEQNREAVIHWVGLLRDLYAQKLKNSDYCCASLVSSPRDFIGSWF